MEGKKQIERSTVIHAPAEAVWEVLADSRLLPEWAPVVDEVTECSIEGEAVG
ncbi:MAG: SRPBCC family protein, partial [Gaiellaceae bacterium]